MYRKNEHLCLLPSGIQMWKLIKDGIEIGVNVELQLCQDQGWMLVV